MDLSTDPFEFDYVSGEVVFGRGCVASIGETLADHAFERALVVCGTNVGANRAVMDPVEAGVGDRSTGVFDETTPEKYVGTVLDGAERMRADEADVLIAVGSGSTLNVARAMSAIAPLDRSRDAIVEEIAETGVVPVPDRSTPPTPLVVVPTTMAGADISSGGGINLSSEPKSPATAPNDRLTAQVSDPRLMATALFYDPELFATTPSGVLTSSAMNGFNKGIETLYSRKTTPISDAHAVAGLRYLHAGLPRLREASLETDHLDRAIIGTVLVQYGKFTNIIHTFGNGVSFHYDVQQGTVHGIVTPHVLRYVFDRVDGRRRLIASGLGIDFAGKSDGAIADAVIDEVRAVRDDLGLPSRLRVVDGLERDHLPAVADVIASNRKHARNPPGIDPSAEDVLDVLEAAW